MELPIWKTTTDILDYCWNERRAALRHGIIPVLVIFLTTVIAKVRGIDPNTMWQTEPVTGLLLFVVFPTLVYLPITVFWYRRIVLGQEGVAGRSVFVLGRLEWRVLIWQILLLLLIAAIAGIAATIVALLGAGANALGGQIAGFIVIGVLGAVTAFVFFVAVTRLSLVIAMAAAGHPAGPKRAWKISKGIGTRMTIILALVVLAGVLAWALVKIAAFLLGVVLGLVSPVPMEDVVAYFGLAGEAVAGLATFLFMGTLFGFVYRDLQIEPATTEISPAAETPAP